MITTSESELLTSREVAAILRLGRAQVQRMAKAGELPMWKLGHAWRISRGALGVWLVEKWGARKITVSMEQSHWPNEGHGQQSQATTLSEVVVYKKLIRGQKDE